MLTVAVTGGIGSGKSTLSRALADLGAVVIDSDRLAREVVAPGTPGLAAVVAEFGPAVVADDGSLDRARLAGIVFADAGARARLEGITHPLVRAAFRRAQDAAGPDAIVVNDIPLLRSVIEAARFHLVMTVTADDDIRVRRLVGRGLDEQDARARMRAQISDADRRPLSDIWIDNDGDEAHLCSQVERIWRERIVPMSGNVAARRRAPRPRPTIVDHDPAWATLAALLSARVSAACGGARCDHIGSTAVPGLPAKPVIDLQVGVADSVALDSVENGLAVGGFPLVPGSREDHPHPAGGDPSGWVKRFHANADPGYAVNVHVRVLGAPNWRWALLIRDWLRAEPTEQAEYSQLKRDLATHHTEVAGYAEAKEPWFAAASVRAESWAQRTGWTPPAD